METNNQKSNIIGSRISNLRTGSTPLVTQRELAQAINVDRTKICKIESGERLATIEELMNIADYLDVSVYYLMGLTDCRQSNLECIKSAEIADKTAINFEYQLALKEIQSLIDMFKNISGDLPLDLHNKLTTHFYNSIKKK